MNINFKNIIMLITLIPTVLFAVESNKLQDISYSFDGDKKILEIKLQKKLKAKPNLLIKDSIVQVTLPKSTVWPKIEKSFKLEGSNKKMIITAYQYNKDTVRFRAIAPNNFKFNLNQIKIIEEGHRIKVVINNNGIVSVDRKKKAYDENLLEQLLTDQGRSNNERVLIKTAPEAKDQVSVSLSGNRPVTTPGKNNIWNEFSVMGFVAKFIAFMAVIIIFFYGISHFFRKGTIKKGQFGFLKNMNAVSVISNTYLAPKKSLAMVRVNKQVFLLGVSDNGINMLSEIDDVAEVLKEGEKQVSGTNFDTELKGINDSEKGKKFTLKRDTSSIEVKDKIKNKSVSEKIKNRVKNLKALQ